MATITLNVTDEEKKLIIYALGLGHRSKIYEIQNYSQK